MSKRRKTRQQKIIAQLRRNLQTQNTTIADNVVIEKSIPVSPQNKPNLSTYNEYAFVSKTSGKGSMTNTHLLVMHDLKKTMTLTLTIALAEIALFFLLKNKLIMLPMFGM